MPLSLKTMLKKFAHKGQITQEEYEALVKKLEGHDKTVRAKAIDEFAEKLHDLCGVEIGEYQYTDLLHESRIDEIAEQLKEE